MQEQLQSVAGPRALERVRRDIEIEREEPSGAPIGTSRRAFVEAVEDPICHVTGLAYVRFAAPDLVAMARFAEAFGLCVVGLSDRELRCASMDGTPFCYVCERAPRARFVGMAFDAPSRAALHALTAVPGFSAPRALDRSSGGDGCFVRGIDPSGFEVDVVWGRRAAVRASMRRAEKTNLPAPAARVNAPVRPLATSSVFRLGHVVLDVFDVERSLAFYAQNFGLLLSDALCLPDGSPAVCFLRCNRGTTPTDHHSLVLSYNLREGHNHSAFEMADIDALGVAQRRLRAAGYRHVWGLGRHKLGSQLFDYFRDPSGFVLEHYADGDVFDASVKAGYHALGSADLYQWGADVPKLFGLPELSGRDILKLAKQLAAGSGLSLAKLLAMKQALQVPARPWLARRS